MSQPVRCSGAHSTMQNKRKCKRSIYIVIDNRYAKQTHTIHHQTHLCTSFAHRQTRRLPCSSRLRRGRLLIIPSRHTSLTNIQLNYRPKIILRGSQSPHLCPPHPPLPHGWTIHKQRTYGMQVPQNVGPKTRPTQPHNNALQVLFSTLEHLNGEHWEPSPPTLVSNPSNPPPPPLSSIPLLTANLLTLLTCLPV
jgi:hypothetical protein